MNRMRVGVAVIASLLSSIPAATAAQQASMLGIAADSVSGRPLEGVEITLDTGGEPLHRAFTDRNGFYQMQGIAAGTYTLRSRRVGYLEGVRIITLVADQLRRADVRMGQAAVALEGVEVTAERGATVSELSRQIVTPADLRTVPVPAGSGDLVSYLQTLPGVTSVGDRGGQLFVRGGTPTDNLVLVDGIPVYQPFHIVGFFSVFPEDLVSTADFYPSGFGARYQGRSSSVLDVRLREGNPRRFRGMASVGTFLAEGLAEGPVGGGTWLASVRRSLVEETSGTLFGTTQPLTFESGLIRVSTSYDRNERCSALALHTVDRGRLDPEDTESKVAWKNLVAGLRCVALASSGQLLEAHWNYTRSSSEAVARGSSRLNASVERMQHDLHVTGRIGPLPVEVGYQLYFESMTFDAAELISGQMQGRDYLWGASAYAEPTVRVGDRVEVRPGVVLVAAPQAGVEPRLRVRWEPFGYEKGALQGAAGLYRQQVVGVSDVRDVGSVFVAWMQAADGEPLTALHTTLGWQQPLGGGFSWSVDGYYKRMTRIPVTVWSAVAQFNTQLTRADGTVWGADVRVEYTRPRVHAFLGYGYSWTRYDASQREFTSWFGEPVQSYHPPHDRRHQVNAILNLDLGLFTASARWQFGSGLPFTRPVGFDEAFDFARGLPQVNTAAGTTRLLLDRPFTGRMPVVHRLDVSLERGFNVSFGRIVLQAGVINAYGRQNMFYYDLFSGRRLDQLPLAPYASVTVRSR